MIRGYHYDVYRTRQPDAILGNGLGGRATIDVIAGYDDLLYSAGDLTDGTSNTIAMSGLKLLFAFPAPIILALLLNELPYRGFKRVLQTVTYMPHFLSWVVVSYFVFSFLSVDRGLVNRILEEAGQETVQWYLEPGPWPLRRSLRASSIGF